MTLLEAISDIKSGQELYVWGGQEGWDNKQRICCVVLRRDGTYDVIDEQKHGDGPDICADAEEASDAAIELVDGAGYYRDKLAPADIRWVVAGTAS